jgi:glucose-6-phosphate isomerase
MRGKIDKMFSGVHINTTEDRSVLHAALRAPRNAVSACACCSLPCSECFCCCLAVPAVPFSSAIVPGLCAVLTVLQDTIWCQPCSSCVALLA